MLQPRLPLIGVAVVQPRVVDDGADVGQLELREAGAHGVSTTAAYPCVAERRDPAVRVRTSQR